MFRRSASPLLRHGRRLAESLPVRIGVTCGLLALVATHISWGTMEHRLEHGKPVFLALAIACVVAALAIGALRWRRLLHRAGLEVPAGPLVRIYAVATFSGTFLPTSVGADVTRTLLVSRRRMVLPLTVTTVMVDRLGGLVGLLLMAWIAFALQSGSVPDGAQIFLIWVTAAVVVGTALLVFALYSRSAFLRRLVPSRLVSIARDARDVVRRYAENPATIAIVLVASVTYQALVSLQLVMIGHAIGVHLPFATAAVTLALVTIVTLIPISIGGFGVREGTYVVLLGAAGIGATDATLISLLTVALLFVASLPGAYLLARGGLSAAMDGTHEPEPAAR
jgi:hypothetical protein